MIVEVEYEVDPAAYGTDDPQPIIEMEQMSFDQDPADLLGRDEAQHWVDVEDITNATTPQQPSGPEVAKAHLRHPKYNIEGTLTGRTHIERERGDPQSSQTIEQKPDDSVGYTYEGAEDKPNDRE